MNEVYLLGQESQRQTGVISVGAWRRGSIHLSCAFVEKMVVTAAGDLRLSEGHRLLGNTSRAWQSIFKPDHNKLLKKLRRQALP